VLDRQQEAGPAGLGPAAGPYLIVFVDPQGMDRIDNVIYASEVAREQWEFEQALRRAIASEPTLGGAWARFRGRFAAAPQAMTHLGIAMSEAELEAALERLASPRFAGRVSVRGPYRPGGPGSVDDRVIQAFVYTDLVATGLLTAGQQIERQVRVHRDPPGAPRPRASATR
jgi:hypothetical protein